MTNTIPSMGLGTFRLQGEVVRQSVLDGLEVGYRHIDTAQIYENEADVGQAIAQSGIARGELFVTTKIWLENLGKDKLIPSLEASLDRLRMAQVDLTLIHWPSTDGKVPLAESLEALAQAKDAGLTKLIGISNFPIQLVDETLKVLDRGQVATNQVEVHPFLQNAELRAFSAKKGIHVTAYQPLAYGKVMSDPVLQSIAAKHGVTPAHVSIAWLLRLGMAVIPASTKKAHLKANLEAQKLVLDADDMARIATIDRGERLVSPDFAPAWD
ncbi:2,5-didehydrogluconate reductase DkgB [Pendulispora brunnea]|uniref:2,5-didehydrogluconate reductase DkgB n=1 Tax=Pendulispora brunnea TaxID=2905690 RepID=A0ABZ2K7M7_9BACT